MMLARFRRLAAEFAAMPRVRIDLMADRAAGNDPFFARLVADHHRYATARHPKLPVVRRMSHGVALCPLPPTFAEYYMRVDGSARRNHKKAVREGCSVRRIAFNDHLDGVRAVRMSAEVRQGKPMPADCRAGVIAPIDDPPSNSPLHDYPYFGVFAGTTLVGYAGCLIAGEACLVEQILGHADHLSVGAVPLLLIGIAEHLYRAHPQVRYYVYGTYFGGGESLRRFKRKFLFRPHRVDWVLSEAGDARRP
jgi:hypothetical protein